MNTLPSGPRLRPRSAPSDGSRISSVTKVLSLVGATGAFIGACLLAAGPYEDANSGTGGTSGTGGEIAGAGGGTTNTETVGGGGTGGSGTTSTETVGGGGTGGSGTTSTETVGGGGTGGSGTTSTETTSSTTSTTETCPGATKITLMPGSCVKVDSFNKVSGTIDALHSTGDNNECSPPPDVINCLPAANGTFVWGADVGDNIQIKVDPPSKAASASLYAKCSPSILPPNFSEAGPEIASFIDNNGFTAVSNIAPPADIANGVIKAHFDCPDQVIDGGTVASYPEVVIDDL